MGWKILALAVMLPLLAACGTNAVISDLESDKVKVQARGGDMAVIDEEARRGCAIHGRSAVQVSYICLDQYCIRKEYLYACQD